MNTDERNGDRNSDGRKIWFPAKRYGWGWGPPNCWQGWVFFVSWLAVLVGGAFFFLRPGQPHFAAFFIFEALLIVIMVIVCLLKGEKPGWRWGRK